MASGGGFFTNVDGPKNISPIDQEQIADIEQMNNLMLVKKMHSANNLNNVK
jgi:hypothetical protein